MVLILLPWSFLKLRIHIQLHLGVHALRLEKHSLRLLIEMLGRYHKCLTHHVDTATHHILIVLIVDILKIRMALVFIKINITAHHDI